MKKVWVFDIDGTLADNEHRQHHIGEGKKNWDAFFAEQHKDEPYQPVLDILHALAFDRVKMLGDKIIVVTARDERFRADTMDWLNKHLEFDIAEEDVYMRPLGDRGNDDVMKVEIVKRWLAERPEFRVGAIFDDRHRIIDAFRAEGWYTFECNQFRREF